MLGKNIRRQRLLRNLKQEHVAQELGVTQPTYSRIERGIIDPSGSQLERIARAIGCDVCDFFDREQPPPRDPAR